MFSTYLLTESSLQPHRRVGAIIITPGLQKRNLRTAYGPAARKWQGLALTPGQLVLRLMFCPLGHTASQMLLQGLRLPSV